MSAESRLQKLIASYHMEQISELEFAELEEALRSSEEAREMYHRAARIDSGLRREAENGGGNEAGSGQKIANKVVAISPDTAFQRKPFLGGIATAAAVVLLSALTWTIAAQKRVVATLVSSEDAGWESSLPTVEGAQLTKGALRLNSGIATIRFDSGVEATLEAPARLYLKGPKKVKLISGTVVIEAHGAEDFMVEMDYGQVVLNEGEFIASSNPVKSKTNIEVLSGEAFVSHDISREAAKLTGGGSATMRAASLKSSEVSTREAPFEQFERGIRIGTNGRSATFIRNNNPRKWTRPEFLTLKKSNSGNGFDQYSVVAFDLSAVDAGRIEEATFRVNLVPSGIGLASRLPKVNRFAVYGVLNSAKENWSITDRWEDAPSPADGKLVGQFEIPRSQKTGAIEITGETFSDFVRERAGRSASFVIVRETANVEGEGHGLTHALASDSHPEAAGPILEVSLKD